MPKSLKYFNDTEKSRRYRNKQRKQNYAKGREYQLQKRHIYSPAEELLIVEHLYSDREIAFMLHVSVAGIQVKRCYLNKLREL